MITSEQIVALRDVDRLSWTDIAARTGLTEETLRARYRQAAGTLPTREWQPVSDRRAVHAERPSSGARRTVV